jgi:hypothetical protein
VQPLGSIGGSLLDIGMDCDSFKFRDVVEGDGLAKQPQDVTTTGSAEGSILMVR